MCFTHSKAVSFTHLNLERLLDLVDLSTDGHYFAVTAGSEVVDEEAGTHSTVTVGNMGNCLHVNGCPRTVGSLLLEVL